MAIQGGGENRTAIVCVTLIVMTLILMGVSASVVCAIMKVSVPDFGVKEVAISVVGGLIGFVTGAAYSHVLTAKPELQIKKIEE